MLPPVDCTVALLTSTPDPAPFAPVMSMLPFAVETTALLSISTFVPASISIAPVPVAVTFAAMSTVSVAFSVTLPEPEGTG